MDIYYQVSAIIAGDIDERPYPTVMGYYDTPGPDEAFLQFLQEHAPTLVDAQKFFDDIIVIPVPKDGYKYKLSNVYSKVVPFPNHKN